MQSRNQWEVATWLQNALFLERLDIGEISSNPVRGVTGLGYKKIPEKPIPVA